MFERIKRFFVTTPTDQSQSLAAQQSQVEPVEYKGYLIYVAPRAEGGQFRVAGRIDLTDNGNECRQHQFVRSDLCMDRAQAEQLTLQKAKTFIDQIGEQMFES